MNETPLNRNSSTVVPSVSPSRESVGASPIAAAGDQDIEWTRNATVDLLEKLGPVKFSSDFLFGLTSDDPEAREWKEQIHQAIARISMIIEHGLQSLLTRRADRQDQAVATADSGQDAQRPDLILGGCALDSNNCMVVVLISISLLKTKFFHDDEHRRAIETLDRHASIFCDALKSVLLTTRQRHQPNRQSPTA